MAEINACTLMFELGPEYANDPATSAKIAPYADRIRLVYQLTGEGVLLLHGRGVKIHLRKGVVTLRDALDLHALPKRVVSRRLLADFRDNSIVLNTDTNATTQSDMLHVRKMALVDPLMLKSLGENTTPQPPVDKILRDLDAEMTSISDGDEREKVRLYNQVLLRYNDLTKDRAPNPTPVVVVKADAVEKDVVMEAPPAGDVDRTGEHRGYASQNAAREGTSLLSRLSKVAWNERRELMNDTLFQSSVGANRAYES